MSLENHHILSILMRNQMRLCLAVNKWWVYLHLSVVKSCPTDRKSHRNPDFELDISHYPGLGEIDGYRQY